MKCKIMLFMFTVTNLVASEISQKRLLKSIIEQVDDVYLKAQATTRLSEIINNQWNNKENFEKLKQKIIELQQDRFLKQLEKQEVQKQELVLALRNFYKNISEKNAVFSVGDSMGVAASRKQAQQQADELKDVLSVFDTSVENLSPLIEAFLRSFDAQTIAMVKDHDDRVKKARALAQQAADEGSVSLFEKTAKAVESPEQEPAKITLVSAKQVAKTAKTPEAKQARSDSFMYITNVLQDHVGEFDNQHENDFTNFLKNEIAAYPNPTKADQVPSNPEERTHWLNTVFEGYSDQVKDGIVKYVREFKRIDQNLGTILDRVKKISSDDELVRLSNDQNLRILKARMNNYKNVYDTSSAEIDRRYKSNVDIESDPLKGPMTLSEYHKLHTDLMNHIQYHLEMPLINAKDAVDQIDRTIQSQRNRLQQSSEK